MASGRAEFDEVFIFSFVVSYPSVAAEAS